jgi:hypothetical protein
MKVLIIIIGLVLLAVGLTNTQSQPLEFISCFCGGWLVGYGLSKLKQ